MITARVARPRSGQDRITTPAMTSRIAVTMFPPRPSGDARGREAHDAGDDEPDADDQGEHHERVKRLLDQYQAGEGAEHPDEREQAAAVALVEDRGEQRHTRRRGGNAGDDRNVLSVSWGETTKHAHA